MNKIKINPRGHTNRKNDSTENETNSPNASSGNINEDISYFLDKNIHDFTKGDLQQFQLANQAYINDFSDTTKRVINKLFAISKILIAKKMEIKEESPKENTVNTLASLPENFIELKSLITEVIEDNYEESIPFLTTLTKELIAIDTELKKEEVTIENLYNLLSEMLQKLQSYTITQQKYMYRSISNSINQKIPNYNFISPEDGNFVDPKFHKVVSGNGQRILRGLSYILLDKDTEEVLKFGNVKTI